MGMRPSGLGERLKSRQYEDVAGAAEEGERWPLVVGSVGFLKREEAEVFEVPDVSAVGRF